MGSLGFDELVVVVIIAIIVFGKDLPSVARKVGVWYARLKRHVSDIRDEFQRQLPDPDEELQPPPAPIPNPDPSPPPAHDPAVTSPPPFDPARIEPPPSSNGDTAESSSTLPPESPKTKDAS